MAANSSSSSSTSAPSQGDSGQGAASAVPISMYPAAATAAQQSGSTSAGPSTGSGSRLNRGTSFRIPLPPNSPSIGSATGNGTPGAAGGFASPPLGHPASPGGGAGGAPFQPGSFTGSTNSTSSSSRFGGLVQGFRRNRGHSTNRGDLASPSGVGIGSNAAGNAPLPSPPASASFPQLTTSGSLNDIVPSATSPYFEAGGTDAGGSQSQQYAQQQQQQQQQAGGRGYFSRRGFGRKNTGGFLGGGGGQRTPTGEAPPPLLRSRSSSQPTVPAGHPHAGTGTGTGTGNSNSSFFPQSAALARPATASSPLQERSDPLAASTATAVRPAPAGSEPTLAAAASTNTTGTSSAGPATTSTSSSTQQQHIRLVPHLESSRSLTFDPVSRDVSPTIPLRIGRFTERNPNVPTSSIDQNRVAFKSKVVSRTHAEIWYDPSPPAAAPATGTGTGTAPAGWFIRDLKSSSGTFLNHIRLSGAGMESRPFNLRDGDVLQLGVDYQGGTEEIYRCVKMRVELNRGWQRGVNSFNSNALAQIRAFGNVAEGKPEEKDKTKKKKRKKEASTGNTDGDLEMAETKPAAAAAAAPAGASSGGVTDCCICLFSVTVYQALFIAPCSHIFHFKCIRPLVEMHHPGFSCPLCRTFADLEADVEQDDVAEPVEAADTSSEGSDNDDEGDDDVEAGEAAMLPPELSADAGPSSAAAQLDVNLDTLRPGKRSPHLASIGQFGQSAEGSGQSTARASSEVARAPATTSPGASRPAGGRRTPSSASRRSSTRASMDRGDTPSRAMGFSSSVSGPSGSGNGGADDSFFPPSAGDFQHDVRRSSIFVQGADGLPMQIPVTGRSRPGSVYEADASDGNISISSASGNGMGTAPGALSERNRARSSRSLRMSTTSITSLREVMAAQQSQSPSQSDQRPVSPDTPRRPRHSHPGGLTPTGASAASREQGQADGLRQGHAERAQNATEYHDFEDADGDGDMSPPPTARPDGDIESFASPTAAAAPAEADGSPSSMFTAPLPGSSQPSMSLSTGLGGSPVLGSSSATAALPDTATDEQDDSDSSGSVPGASGVSQAQAGAQVEAAHAALPDKKGKGRQISEEVGTLPGGLENLAIGEVDGAGGFGMEKTDGKGGAMPSSESTAAS